jgi:zinc protease
MQSMRASSPWWALVVVVAASASAQTTFEWPYPRAEKTLANGMRVVVMKTDTPGFFALHGVVGVGSRDEVESGRSGYAHFFEHMMFKGTKKVPANARVALLAKLGVDESGYTTDDATVYHLQGPTTALEDIVTLEADRYANLFFTDEDVKTESRAVLGEYNKNFADPEEKAFEVLSTLAFDQHTYRHTTIGFRQDIEAMPLGAAYARTFFQRFYTPDNVVFVVAGDVDAATVFARMEAAFGAWQGKRAVTSVVDEPALKSERRTTVAWNGDTDTRLLVGWRVPSSVRDVKSAAALMVLQALLFGDASALVQRLVRTDEAAFEVGSWWSPHRDASLFPVHATMRPGHSPDEAMAAIQRSLDDVRDGKVDSVALANVKSALRYGLLMELTSAKSIAGTLAGTMHASLNPRAVDELFAAIAAVDAAQVQQVVSQHFAAKQRAIVVLAPKSPRKTNASVKGAP